MEYIDLRGTTYESPAVCKYTGADHTSLHTLICLVCVHKQIARCPPTWNTSLQ